MSGIVTMTDLIECIVGDLEENTETNAEPEKDIEPIDSKTWKISGSAPMDDVVEALGITLEEESDCDTFGGYVMGIIGTIPEDGTTLTAETEHLSIKVTEIKDHRIEKPSSACWILPQMRTRKRKRKIKNKPQSPRLPAGAFLFNTFQHS